MYLIDMQKTKGHVSTLNRACWNPKDLNVNKQFSLKVHLALLSMLFFLNLGIHDMF